MIKVCGSSDDLIEITIRKNSGKLVEEEYDSYEKDTLFRFDDGTKLRMTYQHGTWRALVEETGTAKIAIDPLIRNDDWYSDLFTIETDVIQARWKE